MSQDFKRFVWNMEVDWTRPETTRNFFQKLYNHLDDHGEAYITAFFSEALLDWILERLTAPDNAPESLDIMAFHERWMTALREKINEQEQQLTRLEAEIAKLDDSTSQHQIQELQDLLEQSIEKVEHWKAVANQGTEDYQELDREYGHLHNEKVQLQQQTTRLKAEIYDLRNQYQNELDAKDAILRNLRDELDQKDREIARLQNLLPDGPNTNTTTRTPIQEAETFGWEGK